MKIARILALPVVFLMACSSESAAPPQDTGLVGDGDANEAPDTNPDGVAYPSSNLEIGMQRCAVGQPTPTHRG